MVISLNRRDVIIRELDSAIWLWFFNRDPVAIHLLAMPAYTCLEDLGRRSGRGPRIKMHVAERRFGLFYDYCRHASSDPNDLFDFAPRTNDYVLWEATISFEKIFGGLTAYMKAFQAYFVLWLVPEKPEARENASAFLPNGITVDEAVSLGKPQFFDKLTDMFAAEILSNQQH
jgi:hypothetical protein